MHSRTRRILTFTASDKSQLAASDVYSPVMARGNDTKKHENATENLPKDTLAQIVYPKSCLTDIITYDTSRGNDAYVGTLLY